MENHNIIVMLSGEGTTLQAILDKCTVAKVVGVLSDHPNVGGITRAQKANVRHIVLFDRRPNETKEAHTERMIRGLDIILQMNDNISYIVLAGFMRILSADFIKHFNDKGVKIINIHPSLLPKYKGLHTHQKALDNEDEEHGMTIHYVNEEMDGGEIIFQKSVYITDADSAKTLEKKVKVLEQEYYPKVIDSLILGAPLPT